jgi:hypothetical protein
VPVLMRHGAQSRHAQGPALIRAGLAGAAIGPAGQPVTEHPGPAELTEPLARLSPQARFASRLIGPGET